MRKLFSLRVAWLLLLAAAISWAGAAVRDWLVLSYPAEDWLFNAGNVCLVLAVGCFVVMPLFRHFDIPDKDHGNE